MNLKLIITTAHIRAHVNFTFKAFLSDLTSPRGNHKSSQASLLTELK